MSSIMLVLLQAAGGGGGGMMPLLLICMVAVMYFFMIRPQQKRAKEQKKFQESLVTGDKIVTIAGIHGRITRVNSDGTILIEVDRNTNITMDRTSISSEMSLANRKKIASQETVTVVEDKTAEVKSSDDKLLKSK